MPNRIACIVIALAVLLVACGAPAPAAPARVEVAAAQTSTAVVIGIVIREGTTDAIVCLPNVADCPVLQTSPGVTSTPIPQTASPTIPLTNTPKPTATRTELPTNTAIHTPSPDASPTPPATSTPGSATPAPDGKLCEAVIAIPGGINIRAAASTTSTIKSKAPQGTRVTVERFVTAGGYLWAYLPTLTGYMVVGQYAPAPFAWWVSFNSNEFCDTKPGWDFTIPAPPEIAGVVSLVWHETAGGDIQEMVRAGQILQEHGITGGVKSVSDPNACLAAMSAGQICVYREWTIGDCPNILADPVPEATRWMTALWGAATALRPTYLELVNECQYDPMDLTRFWNPFLVEAIRLGKVWGYPPVIAPTFGPGNPPQEWYLDLIGPALVALRDSGGLLGLHAYSITGPDLCPIDQWLSHRHRRVYAKLVSMGLSDLGLAITEVGRGSGNEIPNVEDFACWYQTVSHDPGVKIVAFWTAGRLDAWPRANLNSWMIPIAQRVVALR